MGTQQSIGKSVVQQFVGVAEYSLKPQLKGITVFFNFFPPLVLLQQRLFLIF